MLPRATRPLGIACILALSFVCAAHAGVRVTRTLHVDPGHLPGAGPIEVPLDQRVVRAEVVTAHPLAAGQEQRLRSALESMLDQKVKLTVGLDPDLIAGFVARHGEALNLPDVTNLPAGAPYRFDADFDRRYGYRTRSMLTVPLKTPQGRVLGVLQLLNRKVRLAPHAGITAVIRVEVAPFSEESVHLAGLSEFIGKPISLSAEAGMNPEQYDIVLM